MCSRPTNTGKAFPLEKIREHDPFWSRKLRLLQFPQIQEIRFNHIKEHTINFVTSTFYLLLQNVPILSHIPD